ncbi:MAG TPA: hypothetical protein QGF05_05825 [Dehalococcoidia bacterium]|nr:hypothetical protein [Dehalococcoidia bacterium]
MEALAAEYAGRAVSFFSVYVRDAHAGGAYPQPEDIEQRLRYADNCRKADGQKIPMIVDEIENPIHTAYGGLPNMVYVIDSRGKVAFRSSWTKHDQVRHAVERLVAFDAAQASGKATMGALPSWSEQSLPPAPEEGPAGLIQAIEVWEAVENFDEPERFLGPEMAERFRAAYKMVSGRDSIRPGD